MPSFSGFIYRCIAGLGAILLIGVSAAQNISHGYNLGLSRSEEAALILAAGSLGGALMQPVAFLAAFSSFRSWAIGKGLVALALGVACFAYATTSSLGFVATSRDIASATRGADADAYAIAKAKADAAATELKTLAIARPAAELQAEIDAIDRMPGITINGVPCGGTLNGRVTREFCPKRSELVAEKARAHRRAALELVIAAAEKTMGARHGAGAADPQASALAAYGAALGLALEPDSLSPWLTLLAVVFFELGAAGSLIVVSALPSATGTPKPAKVEAARAPNPPVPAINLPVPQTGALNKRGRKRAAPLPKVMERLEAAGGQLEGNLDEIGGKLGLTKSSAHRALHMLATAGLVALSSSPAGTLVQVR